MRFTSSVISGAGRGKKLGVPTFNLDLSGVPPELEEGVYAVRADFGDGTLHAATMHYGPRPTFGDSMSCEVHLLEVLGVPTSPAGLRGAGRFQGIERVTVDVVQKLRDIQTFESAEGLVKQMRADGKRAKEILEGRK